MSLLNRAQWSSIHKMLLISQKRNTVREAIHRHVEPNKFKKHMLAACEPYFKRKFLQPEERCKGVSRSDHPLHPLEEIIVKELLDDIAKSNFILFIQYNYTQFQSERVYKNTITNSGGKFHALNNNIYKETFRILKLDSLNHLFVTRNALITGQVEDMPKCVTALKKMPQFLLLAGLVDNEIYNVDEIRAISVTSNIDICRANLVATLENPAIELSAMLEQHSESIKPAQEDK